MWDRETFVRPIAHRGLHDPNQGRIENTWPAFAAAIEFGVGIECDIQSSADRVPLVFHDFNLDRLTNGTGAISARRYDDIRRLQYLGQSETILSFEDFLERVGGKTPVLAEIKSDWSVSDPLWIERICILAQKYPGPLALMSFDPAVLTHIKDQTANIPLGVVSGIYRHPARDPWWPDVINPERAKALTELADLDTLEPDFIAYHVADLDCDPVRRARAAGLPVFTWTVRSETDWQLCRQHADSAIFEGPVPDNDRASTRAR